MLEFQLPEHLQITEAQLHEKMLKMAPQGVDTSEGHMYWDHTKPTAMIAGELVEYTLPLTLMLMFPQFAVGPFLDYHGYPIGVTRKEAVKGTTIETFVGDPGIEITKETIILTIGDEFEESVRYQVKKGGIIDSSGEINLPIEAVEAGVRGNVPPNTIVGIEKPIKGLKKLFNAEPITDGAAVEDDESYRTRILERHRNKPLSGAKSDYIRWAKEIDGVGDVIVQPLWRGPKTVRVLITDRNRQVATQQLIDEVKAYIDPVDGMGEGKAPIGAHVTVDTITLVSLTIKATFVLEKGYDLFEVLPEVGKNINEYFADQSIIKYTEVGARIIKTKGVADYSNLLIENDIKNIILLEGERAIVSEVLHYEPTT
ncbi:baseplate J/gp47 family protein [Lysinibacillus sp. Bpr_S20]|uniref:baseplate J/gp47 family protein n=1 Tax=Lysinibacillus sp. Bpr_S20 TaxID=2933964 RepID=UPI0020129285|nr:baseplate J/gp47 family protein [Lysinibacillus sp. Bpr_S20]MCL1701633.1 baseplate J/gp47 family protein [Lysinibacillus sp. Bpr_S20]